MFLVLYICYCFVIPICEIFMFVWLLKRERKKLWSWVSEEDLEGVGKGNILIRLFIV